MSEPAAKAKRSWIIIPWLLAILLAVGWSGAWFYGRGRIEKGWDAQVAQLRSQGNVVEYQNRRIGGFPFRYFIRLGEVTVSEPGGWGVAAPAAEAEVSALNPTVIVLVASRGVSLQRPGKSALAVRGEVLRMSIGGINRPAPWRLSIEGRDLTLMAADPADQAFQTMGRFEAHLRPEDNDIGRLFVRIEDAVPTTDNRLSRVAGGQPVSLGLEAAVTHVSALKGNNWPDVARNWSSAGGRLQVEQGGLSGAGTLLSLRRSEITADPAGFASGELKLTLTRASDGVLALGEIGVLPEETAAVASGVAGAQSLFGESRDGLDVTLDFRDGRTLLGPIPLGPGPRIWRDAGAPAGP